MALTDTLPPYRSGNDVQDDQPWRLRIRSPAWLAAIPSGFVGWSRPSFVCEGCGKTVTLGYDHIAKVIKAAKGAQRNDPGYQEGSK